MDILRPNQRRGRYDYCITANRAISTQTTHVGKDSLPRPEQLFLATTVDGYPFCLAAQRSSGLPEE
ncbi:hypothetical protein M441DRAFT_58225 [Trichoderma asperellum CBS 433.97]|uniref:Uncharacterized protein n=1 Tax=Trichoderma asperellum (strain ATCC 204424 / CBS 433.97 / NBRC 101777) TaxID=1042311 RepID=A0A2T3Z7I3_TRIA4|nr:hypothetical protein M441DRAFT_58225 [Trichoderma asperellum CBS 433.97]PTB40742.1 hypothetical protein M441DRAFT_58225 [Trichoderma asperellum CBS 433.97]